MADLPTVGARIRFKREQRKPLSQADLGVAIGLPKKSAGDQVGAWERDEGLPGTENIRALAEYFGITTDWLLCRTDSEEITGTDEEIAAMLTRNLVSLRARKHQGAGRPELENKWDDVEYGFTLLFRRLKDPATQARRMREILSNQDEGETPLSIDRAASDA